MSAADVQWSPEKKLGKGAFGVVVEGVICGSPVAVKLSQTGLNEQSSLTAPQLVNEIRVLRHVRHPNIVFFYGGIVDAEGCRLGIVLEKVDGPTLCQFVLRSCASERETQLAIIAGLAGALTFLHSREPCIVHGDLKSSNILIANRDFCPKLLDFGLSRLMTRCSKLLGGTLPWMAPEVFTRCASRRPKLSADFFSFGRLFSLVVTRTKPLAGMKKQAIIACLRAPQFPPLDWPRASALEECWKIIVDECLAVPESLRPSAKELYEAITALPFDSSATETVWKGVRDLKQVLFPSRNVPCRDEPLQEAEDSAGVDAQKPHAMRHSSDDQQCETACSTMPTSRGARLVQCPSCGLRRPLAKNITRCPSCACELVEAEPSPRVQSGVLRL